MAKAQTYIKDIRAQVRADHGERSQQLPIIFHSKPGRKPNKDKNKD